MSTVNIPRLDLNTYVNGSAADRKKPASQLVRAQVQPFRPDTVAKLISNETRERGCNHQQNQTDKLKGAVRGGDCLERIPSGHDGSPVAALTKRSRC